jgi:Xaa-Pro aminopeptidase
VKGLVPGKKIKDWQREAELMIEKELVDLRLLTVRQIRNQDEERPAFKKYFMHGVGHPLGLDVHDVGLTTQAIQSGWVMTVEPGIYIPEEGFAVRLENDVLVTEHGPVDLMASIPIEADEIESLMGRKLKLNGNPKGLNGGNGKAHVPAADGQFTVVRQFAAKGT